MAGTDVNMASHLKATPREEAQEEETYWSECVRPSPRSSITSTARESRDLVRAGFSKRRRRT